MIYLNALELLRRHAPLPFGWSEVVAGYDFGILSIREIQDWIRALGPCGPGAENAARLEGSGLLGFEAALWAACAEATGARVPRPGHRKWAAAQDLWRIALLREALEWPLDGPAFGEAIDTIITRVGSPEDMLGLMKTGYRRAATADRAEVEAFVRGLEDRLVPADHRLIALAAS